MQIIDEILDHLRKSKFFVVLDIQSGYRQIKIAEKYITRTAFNTKHGHFEFTVVQIGLANAPASLMSMMDNVFKYYVGKFVTAYLDYFHARGTIYCIQMIFDR